MLCLDGFPLYSAPSSSYTSSSAAASSSSSGFSSVSSMNRSSINSSRFSSLNNHQQSTTSKQSWFAQLEQQPIFRNPEGIHIMIKAYGLKQYGTILKQQE